jgi:hypothetical protein
MAARYFMVVTIGIATQMAGQGLAEGIGRGPVPADMLRQSWYPKAPALPSPTGGVVKVNTAEQIYDAAGKLVPGGTILLADGKYGMSRSLILRGRDISLRGESGDPWKVVLDFQGGNQGVAFTACTDATLACLTVENVRQNGIKLNSNEGVQRVRIYNVVGHNVWQRHVKGVKVPDLNGQPQWIEGCRIQYCLFYNDRPKQRGDDPYEDGESRFGFNYVGGMDIMGASRWLISDNVFIGIRGATGECRGAIFLWQNGKDCVIERNIIIDCDTGICLGNSSGREERRHCTGFVVRNNFITRCPENEILADHTRDCRIVHNTVHDPASRLGRLLRVLHASDGLVARNNIFSGPRVSIEQPTGAIDVTNNLVRAAADRFVDPARGNLHLTDRAADAIDKAAPIPDAPLDIDGDPRGDKPDLGADERVP